MEIGKFSSINNTIFNALFSVFVSIFFFFYFSLFSFRLYKSLFTNCVATTPQATNAQTQMTTCRTKLDDYDKTWQVQQQQSQQSQIIHATQSQQLQPICSTGVSVAQDQNANTLRLIFANGVYYAPVIPTTYCTCNSQWTT